MIGWFGSLVVALALTTACNPEKDLARARAEGELAERKSRLAAALAAVPDSGPPGIVGAPIARWEMPGDLAELSGLALTGEGRLFGHGDEVGHLAEIDYRRGVLVKEFGLGSQTAAADFEGLAIADGRFFVITSKGKIYETREGQARERVRYVIHDTRLGKECEVEGLAYDPTIPALLVACKNARGKEFEGQVVIYRWPLPGAEGMPSLLRIPVDSLVRGTEYKTFHPSGIERHPGTGNYVVIAAEERLIAELTPEGVVRWVRPLPKESHGQPEGVALTKDGILLIGDEARQREAAVTLYRYRP